MQPSLKSVWIARGCCLLITSFSFSPTRIPQFILVCYQLFFASIFSQGQLVCSWKSGNMISLLWSHRKLVLILTLNMELPYSSKSKMRARSGSGVRLDYFNRLVYKTILKYQVKPHHFLSCTVSWNMGIKANLFVCFRTLLQGYYQHLLQMSMLGLGTMFIAFWLCGRCRWLTKSTPTWMKIKLEHMNLNNDVWNWWEGSLCQWCNKRIN